MAVDSSANTRTDVGGIFSANPDQRSSDSRPDGSIYLYCPASVERSSYAAALIEAADGLFIDDRQKLVYIDGQAIHLSRKEYTLLMLLAEDSGRVVSNEEIMLVLWPSSAHHTVCDVKQFVYLLRRRVEKDPGNPRRIQSVRGFGYKLGARRTADAKPTYLESVDF